MVVYKCDFYITETSNSLSGGRFQMENKSKRRCFLAAQRSMFMLSSAATWTKINLGKQMMSQAHTQYWSLLGQNVLSLYSITVVHLLNLLLTYIFLPEGILASKSLDCIKKPSAPSESSVSAAEIRGVSWGIIQQQHTVCTENTYAFSFVVYVLYNRVYCNCLETQL